MRVTCTGFSELPAHDANAGQPGAVGAHAGCGVEFDIPDEDWDVKTNASGALVSEHKQAYCPACGTATFVVRQ